MDARRSDFLAALRQRMQPREFRIDVEPLPPQAWATLESLAARPALPPVDPLQAHAQRHARARLLADVATIAWRLRKRMLEPGSDRPREAVQREFRQVESLLDVLNAAGVRVVDHTGQPFDPGQRLEVAAQTDVPGLTQARVQDTVKPTVYVEGEHVQVGTVMVENPKPP